jgi:hypothetical protein
VPHPIGVPLGQPETNVGKSVGVLNRGSYVGVDDGGNGVAVVCKVSASAERLLIPKSTKHNSGSKK